MVYYSKSEYELEGFRKSKTQNKMYDAILKSKRNSREIKVPFGDSTMENFHDKTGLNLYPRLVHGDEKRRKAFRARHKGYLKEGFYSPSYFSFFYLW